MLPGLAHLPNLENRAMFDAAVFGFLREALPGRVQVRSVAK
jgi:hypothetical protein